MTYRVLVCGGRDYADAEKVRWALERLARKHGALSIAQGGALGADAGALWYAYARGWPVQTFAADWKRLGKSAGPIRNATMLREFSPDYVLAFPGGVGTADMVSKARSAGVPVGEVL